MQNVTIYEESEGNVDLDICGDQRLIAINVCSDWEGESIHLNRDQAIAAARAILKHFNVGVE